MGDLGTLSGGGRMKSKPLVSIIILNWNGGEVMRQCLESLSRIEYPRWELIVVDNGSTDGSVERIQNLKIKSQNDNVKIKIIWNKSNLGFAVANNQGFRRSRGKYILLLNNDTKVKPDFLIKLVDRIEKDSSIGVIQPKIFLMDKPGYLDNAGSFLTRIGFLHHWGFMRRDGLEFKKEREIFSAKGACMLIRREVIEKVGLFDPDFFAYFEESDFCWKVWLCGKKVLFYPDALIDHKLGFTIRRLGARELNYHYYKNRICSLIKNLETRNLWVILPIHIFISLGIAFAFLVKLLPANSLMIIRAIFWNILNLPQTLRKRRFIQKRRVVSDKELFLKLMYPVNWSQYFSDFKRIEEDIKRKN